jgi:TRAP-type mannitol/chloroaromatic compound transport system permease large subunit
MKKLEKIFYIILIAILSFTLGFFFNWEERIIIICLLLSWIPIYVFYAYVIIPIFDFLNCGKIKQTK